MDFDTKHNECIDDVLTLFEVTRERAREVGNFNMSYEGISYMLLRACRVNDQQFIMLTQPTDGRLPNDEPGYRRLFTALRRLGHVVEHHRDNMAAGLRGNKGGGRSHPGAYYNDTHVNSDGNTVDTSAYPQWNLPDNTTWQDNSWNVGSNSSWNQDQWNSGQPSH